MVLPCSDGIPRVPPYSRTSDRLYPYGTITLSGRPFQNRSGFLSEATGLVPFRSPLLRESRLISFPPGTEMFQFPGFASHPYGFRMGYRMKRWVSPFGDPRIKACSQLPTAYRSVPRPSSPPRAKASTRCPYLALEIRHIAMTERTGPADLSPPTAPAVTPCAIDPCSLTRMFECLHHSPCQRAHRPRGGRRSGACSARATALARSPPGGASRARTGDLLLAKQALSQLSYGPGPVTLPSRPVVGPGGLEPPTSRLSGVRSDHLSYEPALAKRAAGVASSGWQSRPWPR